MPFPLLKSKNGSLGEPDKSHQATESAALSWDSCMLSQCALPALTTILRQNGLRFPPPPSATTCISPDFSPGGKRHSKLEKTHKSGLSKARNSCTKKKPRAQKAPIYGPSELLHFAEETRGKEHDSSAKRLSAFPDTHCRFPQAAHSPAISSARLLQSSP